jgi:hypothetical protein
MAWYVMKTYRRAPGGPSTGRLEENATFEASDNAGAIAEACRRAQTLPRTDYAALQDDGGNKIWSGEAPRP